MQQVRDGVMSLAGQRGASTSRAVTFDDLIALNFVQSRSGLLLPGSAFSSTGAAPSGGGGGGGTTAEWSLSDGTTTVADVTSLTVSGATVSGEGGDAVLEIAGSGGGGSGYTPFVRPDLSAFTVTNPTAFVTATDVADGPIVVDAAVGSTYLNITSWGKDVSTVSEFMVSGQFAQRSRVNDAGSGYPTLCVGVLTESGQYVNWRPCNNDQFVQVCYWASQNNFGNVYASFQLITDCPMWYRIYYCAAAANPWQFFMSNDGYAWTLMYQTTIAYTPSQALFYVDQGGSNFMRGGSVLAWDLRTGTGTSLDPYNK